MEKEILVALVGAVTTVIVAIGGWIFAWKIQQETKQKMRMEKKIHRLQKELQARIAYEK